MKTLISLLLTLSGILAAQVPTPTATPAPLTAVSASTPVAAGAWRICYSTSTDGTTQTVTSVCYDHPADITPALVAAAASIDTSSGRPTSVPLTVPQYLEISFVEATLPRAIQAKIAGDPASKAYTLMRQSISVGIK